MISSIYPFEFRDVLNRILGENDIRNDNVTERFLLVFLECGGVGCAWEMIFLFVG